MASEPALPLLNYDILLEVAYLADRRTCASLMLTCKVLNKAAAKSVLQPLSGRVILWTVKDVSLFLRFLHADPSRFQYVREIDISLRLMSPYTDDDVERLLDGLRRMERLNTLGILHAEITLKNSVFFNGVARLTTIKRLELQGAEDNACRLLSQMQADLVFIHVDGLATVPERHFAFYQDIDEYFRSHPVPLLAKWTATLEELTWEMYYPKHALPEFTQVYPKLRRLSFISDSCPHVAPLIRAYPNLARLTVQKECTVDEDSLTQQLRDRRAVNIQSQRDQGGSKTVTWTHLEELVGSVIDLYALGLTCRIPRVHINDSVTSWSLERPVFEFLPAVLEYAQPRHLKVQGDGMLLIHPSYGLTTLLRSGSCPERLESLVVDINFPDEDSDIVTALSDLADSLRLLSLRRLRLRLRITVPDGSKSTPSRYHEVVLESQVAAVITTLENLDLEAYVRDLADDVPSLEDAMVCVKGEREHEDANECLVTRTAEVVRVPRRRLGAEYADREMYEWSDRVPKEL
ncbi:hypothetical protein L227DRAFT_603060 [Lentinus tigrinus ALCF2SS1-6]|uniref:F-box domain-containing protein n=1 Tax=Lentinus tigrinus ALCF2SS1-6 TaxID=1328759 RepID=A0A5C2RZQ2_9APHY|nr:hypothetical protein L227DRAFT_603060 [Lentinus tigrinus ALCF2SS1-6]